MSVMKKWPIVSKKKITIWIKLAKLTKIQNNKKYAHVLAKNIIKLLMKLRRSKKKKVEEARTMSKILFLYL